MPTTPTYVRPDLNGIVETDKRDEVSRLAPDPWRGDSDEGRVQSRILSGIPG